MVEPIELLLQSVRAFAMVRNGVPIEPLPVVSFPFFAT
jgi:hypothetical protein